MSLYLDDGDVRLYHGDALDVLRGLPDGCVDACVTSPPYWGLRDYGRDGQLGLERTPDKYVASMVRLFSEVRRVLREPGTLWLNLGDTYNAYNGGAGPGSTLSRTQTEQRPKLATGYGLQDKSLKPKDLIGIPWRVALALQADGWWLRSDVVWSKPNPMPESVRDRPTKSHEYVFLLAKSETYYFGQEDLREPATWERWSSKQTTPKHTENGNDRYASFGREWTEDELARYRECGRNVRSVWEIPTQPYRGAHFAVFPSELARPLRSRRLPSGWNGARPLRWQRHHHPGRPQPRSPRHRHRVERGLLRPRVETPTATQPAHRGCRVTVVAFVLLWASLTLQYRIYLTGRKNA